MGPLAPLASAHALDDCAPQIGLWLAITEATLENGCLHVVPNSHR